MIEQAKFTYSPLGKAFQKQTKRLKSKEKTYTCYYESKQRISGFNQ